MKLFFILISAAWLAAANSTQILQRRAGSPKRNSPALPNSPGRSNSPARSNSPTRSWSPPHLRDPIFKTPAIPNRIRNKAGALIRGPSLVQTRNSEGELETVRHSAPSAKYIPSGHGEEPSVLFNSLPFNDPHRSSSPPGNQVGTVYAQGKTALVGVATPPGGSGAIKIHTPQEQHIIRVPGDKGVAKVISSDQAGGAKVFGSVSAGGKAFANPVVLPPDSRVE